MDATKRALFKLTDVCGSSPHHIAVFSWTIRLYLMTLSAYTSNTAEHEKNVSSYVTDVSKHFVAWFKKPSLGFEDSFGGKNGKKIKNEIKVCGSLLHQYLFMPITLDHILDP